RVHWIRFVDLSSIIIVLILYNHIMEDDASHHNASEDLLIKHTGRTSNNQPPSLKDAKTPFDIFPVSFLIGSK
ncbi:unnamed protein product, partial [Prunus brigantina]